MRLKQYLGKDIKVTFVNGQILEGYCNSYTVKGDTEDGLYDEITIRTNKYPYIGFNESEIKSIDMIEHSTYSEK